MDNTGDHRQNFGVCNQMNENGNGGIKVIKSDGSKVSIDLDKIHRMVEKACRNITGVSESAVEMNSGLQFYEGISTREIQSILVKSAHDLISTESPNYQFVAARLLLFAIPYLLLILSSYFIKKDDKLVKSSDRIR